MTKYYTIRALYTDGYTLSDTIEFIANATGKTSWDILNMMGYNGMFGLRMSDHTDVIIVRKLNDICKKYNLQTRVTEPRIVDRLDRRRYGRS